MTVVSIGVFVIFLVLAIVTDVLFVGHEKDGYYFLSGVFLIMYAVIMATHTFLHTDTIPQMFAGVVMALVPIGIWSLPLTIRLPWMDKGPLRSDGDD